MPALAGSNLFRRMAARPRYSIEGLTSLLLFAFVAVNAISSLYLLADVTATTVLVQPYPFFRTDEEAAAVAWLLGSGDPPGVVLAAYETGNFVAAQTGFPVVIGHWAETVNWSARLEDSNAFYGQGVSDGWRRQFLSENDVRYVWHGPLERAIGGFEPGHSDYLSLVYEGPDTQIYHVQP